MAENLYHFTSVESLVSMLSDYTAETPNFKLWASNALFMNDASEFIYAASILEGALRQFEKEEGVDAEEAFAYVLSSDRLPFKIDALKDVPFITSLTEDITSAALWDIYAKKGCGIALEFDSNEVHKNRAAICEQCFYCKDSADFLSNKNLRERLLNSYKRAVDLTPMSIGYLPKQAHIVRAYLVLSQFSPILKNASFKYEQEHRLYSQSKDVKFRVKGNVILPYKEIELPASIIKKIVVGPCSDFEYVAMSIRYFLVSKGLADLSQRVEHSTVPYRG